MTWNSWQCPPYTSSQRSVRGKELCLRHRRPNLATYNVIHNPLLMLGTKIASLLLAKPGQFGLLRASLEGAIEERMWSPLEELIRFNINPYRAALTGKGKGWPPSIPTRLNPSLRKQRLWKGVG